MGMLICNGFSILPRVITYRFIRWSCSSPALALTLAISSDISIKERVKIDKGKVTYKLPANKITAAELASRGGPG